MHFRARKVGLVADIERAFLNIAVDEQQRDLMRFLWIDDVRKDDPNIEIYLRYELLSIPLERDAAVPWY